MPSEDFWCEVHEVDCLDLGFDEGMSRHGHQTKWSRHLWGRTAADGRRERATGRVLMNHTEGWAIVHEQGGRTHRLKADSPEDAIRRFLDGNLIDLDQLTVVDVDRDEIRRLRDP